LLDNRLTHGGEVVTLTSRPPFTPKSVSWYSFLLEAESTPGPYSAAGRIRPIKKSNDLIGYPTRDPPACSISASTNYATACQFENQCVVIVYFLIDF
jgi:hypothetical protein